MTCIASINFTKYLITCTHITCSIFWTLKPSYVLIETIINAHMVVCCAIVDDMLAR